MFVLDNLLFKSFYKAHLSVNQYENKFDLSPSRYLGTRFDLSPQMCYGSKLTPTVSNHVATKFNLSPKPYYGSRLDLYSKNNLGTRYSLTLPPTNSGFGSFNDVSSSTNYYTPQFYNYYNPDQYRVMMPPLQKEMGLWKSKLRT